MAVVSTKWCVTDMPSYSVEFEWTIKHFLLITKVVIESAVFSHEGVQWQLQLRRSTQDPSKVNVAQSTNKTSVITGDTWCSLGLCVTSGTPLSAKYNITILGDLQKTHRLVQDFAQCFLQPNQFSFIRQSIHCSEIRKYICNGELRMKCTIDSVSDQSTFHHDSYLVKIPDCDLKTNLTTLLRGGDHSDVTLVAGGREFQAHKNILSARSPVFAKMFKHEMSESILNRVTITDIAPDTMEELLSYIYTGDAPIFKACDTAAKPVTAAITPPTRPSKSQTRVVPPTVATKVTFQSVHSRFIAFQQLFGAADKYQIDRLKACCESAINRAVTVDNAAETLFFADMHNAAQLKKSCTAFIASNRSKVLATPGWSKLAERHDLLLSILQATV